MTLHASPAPRAPAAPHRTGLLERARLLAVALTLLFLFGRIVEVIVLDEPFDFVRRTCDDLPRCAPRQLPAKELP
ncbi:MAG: hypothetical protein SFX73_30845 [Kofleriaceae bacterium]|nr:hypothetical protein [Kofleriaceae bacterium]